MGDRYEIISEREKTILKKQEELKKLIGINNNMASIIEETKEEFKHVSDKYKHE